MIKRRYDSAEKFKPVLETYLKYGVDALMAPFGNSPELVRAVKDTEQKMGREIIMIDTPIMNVSDSAEARKEAETTIKEAAARGSKFCLIHHSSCEQLVNKNLSQIVRLDDYTKMIRDAGMIPGLSAHMPEMTIKPMAAGRCSPYVGLTFSWNAIRERDMVTVGAFSADEVEEDIEISFAALEHRFPDLEKRSSPNTQQAAFGG